MNHGTARGGADQRRSGAAVSLQGDPGCSQMEERRRGGAGKHGESDGVKAGGGSVTAMKLRDAGNAGE